jgi:hypothetical protein
VAYFFALAPAVTDNDNDNDIDSDNDNDITDNLMTNAIIAQLSSDTIASVAGSTIAVHIGSPVLALCRKLVEAGYPSSAEVECYRGETLSLRVRSIGEAAGLYVAATTTGRPVFRREHNRAPASPMHRSKPAAISIPSS